MPVTVAKRGEKYRVIEADTGHIVKNNSGTAVDGGGHSSKTKAEAQARAINASQNKKKS